MHRADRKLQSIVSPAVLALILTALSPAPVTAQDETALDRYVHSPQIAYDWFYEGVNYGEIGKPYVTYLINLTSQTWFTESKVSPHFWRHWLRITVPKNPTSTTAILLIDDGLAGEPQPGPAPPELVFAALNTGLVIAELRGIPNQPLTFTEDGRARSADELVAYTWDKYLRTRVETWPLQLPMTKAIPLAMDTITEFCDPIAANPCEQPIQNFVIGGGSKRGWVSWLAGATDERVVGLVPIATDGLNMNANLNRHYQAYGSWSPALSDYEELGLFAWLGSKTFGSLAEIVDPYRYRDRLTMPKYIMNAAGDEIYLPDSSQLYYDELPGTNFLRYIPNTNHSLVGADAEALAASLSWANAKIHGTPLPGYSWDLSVAGQITVTTQDEPSAVKLWQATNPSGRDFRFDTIGAAWTESDVAGSAGGAYVGTVESPASGYRAFFLELTYTDGYLFPLRFTTPVQVVPNTLPFGPPLVSVHAASYNTPAAPDSIASVFGGGLTDRVEYALALPLPTELAGIRLRLVDANGVPTWTALFYASPGQINYLVPADAVPGLASIEVYRNGQRVAVGQAVISPVAPGIFTANSNGEGVPAGTLVTVKQDLSQTVKNLATLAFDGSGYEPAPFSLGAVTNRNYLTLWGTGMRHATVVTATIDGVPVDVSALVASADFEGLDQVNLGPLPVTLGNRGFVDVILWCDGIPTNTVTIRIL